MRGLLVAPIFALILGFGLGVAVTLNYKSNPEPIATDKVCIATGICRHS